MAGINTVAGEAADALFQTAVRFHQEGALQRAEHLYREVLRQQPRHAAALNMLGVIGCQTGNFGPGSDLIRQALALEPDNADFNNNLGMALMQAGDPAAAQPMFERAVRTRPRFAEAHFNLGNALLATEQAELAEKHYRKALRARADYPDALNNLGNLLRQQGQTDEAVRLFRRLVDLLPDFAGGHFNLALALQAKAAYGDAIAAFRRALAIDPKAVRVWEALGHCCRQRGALDDAADAFTRALELEPGAPALLNAIGLVRFAQNRVEEARDRFAEAVERDPDSALSLNHLGMACSAFGDRDGALARYEQAIDRDAGFGDTYRNLAELDLDEARRRDLVNRIEAQLAREDLGVSSRTEMQFALGKLHDDLGAWDAAFAAFQAANEARHASVRFDAGAQARFIESIIDVFTPEFFTASAAVGDSSEVPVFVVGMPRSGTTLVEQILASHSGVFGAGELTFFPEHMPALATRLGASKPFPRCVEGRMSDVAALAGDYLALLAARGGEAQRVTDKMPYNFLYLGVIAALFPRARIVHCRRDPVATCFSIYTRNLAGSHPYAYALEDLAAAYRGYDKLMAHWHEVLPGRIHDVRYEQLVDDQEGESRSLIAFLGLPWEAGCLEFHRTARPVTTASQWQVRQPVFRTGREHWRHYEEHLAPLQQALDAAASGAD